jgi:hypothetical protein
MTGFLKFPNTLLYLLTASFCIGLTPHAAIAENTDLSLIDSWVAVDLDSDSYKQIDIFEEGGAVVMMLWPSMGGGGLGGEKGKRGYLVGLPVSHSDAKAATAGHPPIKAVKDYKFMEATYTEELLTHSILLTTDQIYKDGSNRDRTIKRYFVRGLYPDDPAAQKKAERKHAASLSGWLGLWRNQNTKARGTLQLHIRDLEDRIVMSAWGAQGQDISRSPTTSVTLPIKREVAAAGKSDRVLETMEDHGFMKTTMKLEFKKNRIILKQHYDYRDPKRKDQDVTDTFERGVFGE